MMRRRRQRGFTFVETTIVSAIVVALITSFGRAFATSDGVMRESRVALRANEELRRNLDSIANCLRGASAASLGNFGVGSTSTAPSFQCVTGVNASGAYVLDTPQTMQWRAPQTGSGVDSAGQVVIVRGGVTKPIASHVPSGGFQAILEGSSLRVHLTTTYKTSQGKTATQSGDVSVFLRN
jgi:type II secretory pathway pseudopilin PulG